MYGVVRGKEGVMEKEVVMRKSREDREWEGNQLLFLNGTVLIADKKA